MSGELLTLPPGWHAEPVMVPGFGRLTDYLGLWAIEPTAFAHLWDFARQLDMREHVARFVPELRSALEMATGPNGQKIAVVKLQGLLMKSQSSLGGTSTIQARRDIRQAVADPDVAGIMLAIDSPGGAVAGTHDLAQEIKAARKAKPVWAHIEDTGASAAYWAASQAERVTANSPTAHVGSIGTFHVIHDHSGAAEKAGVRTLVFSTGPLKGLGAPGSKITDEQAAHVQSLVNSSQEAFDAGVKDGRGLSAAELAAVRHGGVMPAKAAMSAKLIDGIQPLGRTLAEFAAALKKGTTDDYRRAMGIVATGLYGIDVSTGEIVADKPEAPPAAPEPKPQLAAGTFATLSLGGLPTLTSTEKTR